MTEDFLKDYQLVWNDEFDGLELDSSKWNLKAEMVAQSDLELRSDKTAVLVEDGMVKLKSDRINKEMYYTNTSLSTFGRMSFQYGYIEIKAKVPFGKPAWPSFWLLSDPDYWEKTKWKSEIDIFEVFGNDDSLEANVHKWYLDGSGRHFAYPNSLTTKKFFKSKSEAEEWHTYGMLWTSEYLKFFLDGDIYQVIDITVKGDFVTGESDMGGFHDPHYVIFNDYIYTKGYIGCETWAKGKEATEDDIFPINYYIDYVRLYQKPETGKLIIY